MKKIIFGILLLLVLILGCTQPTGESTASAAELAKAKCVELCSNAKNSGIDLSNGPCLGNPIEGMGDWVCDAAHSPREEVDNLPENQCSTFREQTATHFVEVDEECSAFRTI